MKKLNKVLYGIVATGPTFNDRVIDNILNFESYKYFDVLLLTDNPSYKGFDKIKNCQNIFIEDLNEYRNRYKEFDKFEVIPFATSSETEYVFELNKLRSQRIWYPLHLQRFILLYENLFKYKYLLMADCDMSPVMDDQEYQNFIEYLENDMPENSVSSNRCYYTWEDKEYVKEFLLECSKELNKGIKNLEIIDSFDNPMKIFKLDSINKYKSFFYTWNYCLLKVFTEQKNHLILPGSWNITSETLLAIVYKLENITVNKSSKDGLGVQNIKSFTYPEDRFWDDLTHRGFKPSQNSKKEFIENNFNKLKKFYLDYNQPFPYE